MITVIDTNDEIEKCQNLLKEIFESYNPEYINPNPSSRGGAEEMEVMYFKKHDIWAGLGEAENRYWNAFGIGKPIEGRNTSIVCEINFPYDGINRKVAGAFGKENDQIVLLHRGLIGGGRQGIGKQLFFKNYQGKFLDVIDGKKETSVAIIGTLNSKKFLSQVAFFVREIERIKNFDANEIDKIDDDSADEIPVTTSQYFDSAVSELHETQEIQNILGDNNADSLEAIFQLEKKMKNLKPKVKERVSTFIERGSIASKIKQITGYKCLVCEAFGENPLSFQKKNGENYVETHHVEPVSNLKKGSLSIANLLTVCANHHRQMHYGNVEVIEDGEGYFMFKFDDKVLKISKIKL